VGDRKNLIDITHVENAAAAHLQAADALSAGSPVCGKPYFLSQGEPVSCWDWIDEVLALAGLPPVGGRVSLGTACMAGAVLERVHRLFRLPGEPRMTSFLALQLGRSHYFDISRARRDFGYHPRISTAEGMQRLKKWLPLAKPPINR
jgi:nucleoside-diphosphate-sugar epimerase